MRPHSVVRDGLCEQFSNTGHVGSPGEKITNASSQTWHSELVYPGATSVSRFLDMAQMILLPHFIWKPLLGTLQSFASFLSICSSRWIPPGSELNRLAVFLINLFTKHVPTFNRTHSDLGSLREYTTALNHLTVYVWLLPLSFCFLSPEKPFSPCLSAGEIEWDLLGLKGCSSGSSRSL